MAYTELSVGCSLFLSIMNEEHLNEIKTVHIDPSNDCFDNRLSKSDTWMPGQCNSYDKGISI